MAKKKSSLPDDIKRGIVKLAEATKKDAKVLVQELSEVMKTDNACKTMEQKEAKIRFAWTIVASRYSISDGNPCFIKPVYTPTARKTKKSVVGDLACILQKISIEDDGSETLGDVEYARGTFWRDAAKDLEKLKRGKIYKATLRMTNHKFGIEIGGNNPNFKEVDPEVCEIPDIKEFFHDIIEPKGTEIYIDEMNINKSEYPTDIRVIRGTVLKAESEENERGEYAYYDIVDDSILGQRTQRIYIHPKDIEHGQSSIVKFVGSIRMQDDKTPRWEPHFDIAEYSVPRMIKTKKLDEEAEDIDLDGEEEETVEKTEETTEDEEKEEEEPEPEPEPKKTKTTPKPAKDEEEDDEGDLFKL